MIQIGTLETKTNAVTVYCYNASHNYEVDAVLIRTDKDSGRIELREKDGSLRSLYTQGTSWAYVRKLWKTLKSKENRLIMP